MKTKLIIALFLISASVTRADVIFSTMSSSFTPRSDGGSSHGGAWVFKWDQDGSTSFGAPDANIDFKGYRYFSAFTTPTGSGYSLGSIELSLARSLAESNSENIKIAIFSANGNVPNLISEPIETFTGFTVPTIPAYTVSDLPTGNLVLNSVLNTVLDPGTKYFIGLSPSVEDVFTTQNDATYYWYNGDINTSDRAADYYLLSESGWTNLTGFSTVGERVAFSVSGSAIAIPEPSSFAVILGGFMLIGVIIRKRNGG